MKFVLQHHLPPFSLPPREPKAKSQIKIEGTASRPPAAASAAGATDQYGLSGNNSFQSIHHLCSYRSIHRTISIHEMVKVLSKVLLSLGDEGRSGRDDGGLDSSEPNQLNSVVIRMGQQLKAKLDFPNRLGHDQQRHCLLLKNSTPSVTSSTPTLAQQQEYSHSRQPLTDISNQRPSSTTTMVESSRHSTRKRTPKNRDSSIVAVTGDVTVTRSESNQIIQHPSVAGTSTTPPSVGYSQCLGSRRLQLEEIIQLSVQDEFYIIIPPSTRRDSKSTTKMRNDFISRVVDAVIASRSRNYLFRIPPDERHKHARIDFMNKNCYKVNDQQYVELSCCLVDYPYRNEHVNDLLEASEIEQQVQQGGGLMIRLMNISKTAEDITVSIKWHEVPCVWFFVQHFRGDQRPRMNLPAIRNVNDYGDMMVSKLDEVQGCYVQTLELKLAFEEHRTRILTHDLSKANEKLTASFNELHSQHYETFSQDVDEEFANRKLAEFVKAADAIYANVLREHFSRFQSNGRLLDESIDAMILKEIETRFPRHYYILSSIVVGNGTRAHQPSVKSKPAYERKQSALVHDFFALVRQRNPKYMIHWAAIRTLAMYARGNRAKYFQAPHTRAFTACLPTTMKHAFDIYNTTCEIRANIIKSAKIIFHSFDNYNQYHAYKTQRGGSSGIYHIGIVFNVVEAVEFKRPIGTILKHLDSNTFWRVRETTLPDSRMNVVYLEQVDEKDHTVIMSMAEPMQKVELTPSSMEWMVVSMPGASHQVPITYIDQEVPSSLRQRIPAGLSDCDFVLGNRAWMNDGPEAAGMEKLCPRKYVRTLESALRMIEFFRYCKRYTQRHPAVVNPTSNDVPDEDPLLIFFRRFAKLMKESPGLSTNAYSFQVNNLRFWNENYDAKSKFMWMRIIPRDEMKTDEFLLAMVDIFCSLGFIKEEADGSYSRIENSSRRIVFQFGDALSVQKWYNLAPHIVSKITEIGNEEYVSMMMDAYDRFIICHDYLHENIHRLQVVFTLFYGGFIQVAQILLGTTKVQKDPTKGIWVHHERLVMKMIYALERIRMEEFVRQRDDGLNIFRSGMDNDKVCWQLQCEYQDYCDKLLHSTCEKTLAAANFLKLAHMWLMCKESVSVGDWATLEVQGNDWLKYWAAMSKKQYKLETIRRVEQIYKLKPDELEYLRMGRFVRFDEDGGMTTHDDHCEKQNQAQKNCTKNPDFKIVCDRSSLLHLGIRCAKEVFVDKNKPSSIPNLDDDVEALYDFFRRTEVFVHPSTEYKLSDNSFWDHFGDGKCFDGTETKRKYMKKKHVPVDARDREALQTFLNKDALAWDDDCNSDDDDNEEDSIIGDDCSVGSHITHGSSSTTRDVDDDDSMAEKSSDEESVDHDGIVNPEIAEANLNDLLKKGKLARYKMNMDCIKDMSAVGLKKVEGLPEIRRKEREELKRTFEMNYTCNSDFKKNMEASVRDLDEKMKKLQTEPQRDELEWETRRSMSLQMYDDGDIEEYYDDDDDDDDDYNDIDELEVGE